MRISECNIILWLRHHLQIDIYREIVIKNIDTRMQTADGSMGLYGIFAGSKFSELEIFMRLMWYFVLKSADGPVKSAPN